MEHDSQMATDTEQVEVDQYKGSWGRQLEHFSCFWKSLYKINQPEILSCIPLFYGTLKWTPKAPNGDFKYRK